jgi:uncharacterized membrane protein YjgN (DUF898 family)
MADHNTPQEEKGMESSMDAVPTPLDGAGAPSGPSRTLDVRFTGSGSEYFRIWIVNLLLTLVTLTLYWPFARARRIAYFQNNTLVGGDPLGFHADPWRMFRGYLLMLVMGVGYWAISHFMPALAWVPFVAFMVLWPALWRASLQFRLRNTSWRGVRLSFEGDLKSAYVAMLPFFLPGLAAVLVMPALEADEAFSEEATRQAFFVFMGVSAVFTLLMPWFWARLKRYQHGGYAFTQERTSLSLGAGSFYLLGLKLFGLALAVLLGAATLVGIVFALTVGVGSISNIFSDPGGSGAGLLAMFAMVALVSIFYIGMPIVLLPYFTSRMQNLLWNRTSSTRIAFNSRLRFWALFKVTVINTLLLVVTLGLYWPFAKVRIARTKLEAMAVDVQGNVDEWVAQAQQRGKGVLGDAAGDFFGIDMGL